MSPSFSSSALLACVVFIAFSLSLGLLVQTLQMQTQNPLLSCLCFGLLVPTLQMETQDPEAVLRWLDRMLVRFGAKFGRYTPDMPPSFLLGSNLFLFPSFVYHLRRSPFLQVRE